MGNMTLEERANKIIELAGNDITVLMNAKIVCDEGFLFDSADGVKYSVIVNNVIKGAEKIEGIITNKLKQSGTIALEPVKEESPMSDERVEMLVAKIVTARKQEKEAIEELKKAGIEIEIRLEGVKWRRV